MFTSDHTVVILENGDCYASGENKFGQLGIGDGYDYDFDFDSSANTKDATSTERDQVINE